MPAPGSGYSLLFEGIRAGQVSERGAHVFAHQWRRLRNDIGDLPIGAHAFRMQPSARKIDLTSLIVISLLQFGQISTLGTTDHASLLLMTFPFARQNVGAAKRLTLEWVPVSLKSKSWKLAGSLCDSGSIANIVRLLSARVEQNERRGSPRWYPLQ